MSVFEVVEIGPLTKRHWWSKRRWRLLKLRTTKACYTECLRRTFEGYQQYSTQKYRADFEENTVITVLFSESELIAVGDKIGMDTLAGTGQLDRYFRMIVA